MLTPNGGVFGRNPKFNNVTVENNLTVNGDFTLGDDIVINDTLLVNGVATFRGGIISIPNSAAPTSTTVIGSGAGAALQSGAVGNVLVGDQTGNSITSGQTNVFVGERAGFSATTTSNNVAIGSAAYFAGTGTQNIAIGQGAAALGSGAWLKGTIVGFQAGLYNTTDDITAVGAHALDANTTGTLNTAVGKDALGANTTGANAVAVGNNAGHNFGTAALPNTDLVTSATGSIFIGRDARPGANSQTNQIVIGDQGRGNGSNTTTIGNSSTTGTFIPAGNLTLTNGNFIVGTSGKGIDFAITSEGTGTMTSELLGDYEEGTWTPTFNPASGTFTTLTMNVVSATYTKIGRQVTVRAFIRTDNVDVGTAVGHVRISGLPFSAADHSVVNVGYTVTWGTDFPSSGFALGGLLYLYKRATAPGATVDLTVADMSAGANAGHNNVVFDATYFV